MEDLVRRIEKLDIKNRRYLMSDELLSEIITPEWYYSESTRIFENTIINLDSILKSDLINKLSLIKLKNYPYDTIRKDTIFEKSFCSWYQPYHIASQKKWGIHIRLSSWMKIALKIRGEELSEFNSDFNYCLTLSFLYFYYHQIFHNIIENIHSIIEEDTEYPYWYSDYYTKIYLPSFNTKNCQEESLANAYLYEHAQECYFDHNYLKKILTEQESPYSEFSKYIGQNFIPACIDFLANITNRSLDRMSSFDDFEKNIASVFNLKIDMWHNKIPIPVWLHTEPRPLFNQQ